MKTIYPEYYKDFKCIAGSCPDTCCAGWEIVIDEKYCNIYKNSQAAAAKKATSKMYTDSDNDVCLTLTDGRCPLLNRDNLCEIYIEMGKDALCDVCRTYPRFKKEAGGISFEGISLSCPEAARLILSDNSFGQLNKEPEFANSELNTIYNSYKFFRETACKGDFFSCMDIAEEIQSELDFGDTERAEEIIAGYEAEKNIPHIDEVYKTALKISSFDILTGEWKECIELLKLHLEKAKKDSSYLNKRNEAFAFLASCDEIKCIEIYYMYKYFPEAMDSFDIETMVSVAYTCAMVICEMYTMKKLNNDMLSFDLKLRLSQLFSKEIEHNEENLEKI